MLVVPWLVGCGLARAITVRAALLLVGALALFLAQHRLTDWYRTRRRNPRGDTLGSLAFLGIVGLVALAPALGAMPVAVVVALAVAAAAATAASLALIDARVDHALPGQVLAAVSLALAAPAAYVAGGGADGRTTLAAWLVNVAFFLWAVLLVNLQIVARARRAPLAHAGDRVRFGAGTLVADVALAVLALAALSFAGLPVRGLLAFAPIAVQSIATVATLHRPVPLKRVGITMLVHAIAFTVLLVVLV